MTTVLSPHAANLLKAEYPTRRAMVAGISQAFTPPSADLQHQLQLAAEEFGIPVGAVDDWGVWVTAVLAAITSQNWLGLIPLVLQLGSYIPQAWAFIQSIIQLFHGGTTPPVVPPVVPIPAPTGPVITGS